MTLLKLYTYTALGIGSYVCYKNYQNGLITFSNSPFLKMDMNVRNRFQKLFRIVSLAKGVFYGVMFPYTIYKFVEDINDNNILHPLYHNKVAFHTLEAIYRKQSDTIQYNMDVASDRRDIEIGGQIMDIMYKFRWL